MYIDRIDPVKNLLCRAGVHNYKNYELQELIGNLKYDDLPILRIVKKCKRCGKLKYESLILGVSYNIINNNNYEWKRFFKYKKKI